MLPSPSMERQRIAVEISPAFDEQVRALVGDLGQAAAEGEQHLEELLAALPERLRRLLRQSVIPRAVGPGDAAPLPAGAASEIRAAPARGPGRPLGSPESACPALTQLRASRGLSQSELAAAAARKGFAISKSTIGNLEAGAVSPRDRHALAIGAALELPPGAVLELLRNEAPAGFLLDR